MGPKEAIILLVLYICVYSGPCQLLSYPLTVCLMVVTYRLKVKAPPSVPRRDYASGKSISNT